MCLAPQRPASQLPKVARDCQFLTLVTSKCASRHDAMHFFNISASKCAPKLRCLCILTSKCASRHNGVQFLISQSPQMALHSPLLRAYFSTLRSHKTLGKRLFYLFACLDLLSTDLLSTDSFSSDSFSSLPLPTSAASSVHIVGSFAF